MFAIQIEETHIGTAQTLPPRRLSAAMRQINGNTAAYWRDRILPKAFASGAASKRNYRPRQQATIDRKKRAAGRGEAKFGGRRPLVETGLLMETVRSARHRIAATKSVATVYIHGPVYFREQIADEVLRIMPSDAAETDKIANEELGEFFANLKHKVKKKYR